MRISIVLPAYKEEENLREILPKINNVMKRLGEEYEILIVDTMEAMDQTEQVCRENNARYIRRRGGNFYGNAIRTGFADAQGEYIVVMDADGSHDCNDILRFYDVMKKGECDLVIGSRYTKGGQTDNNFILKFMSLMVNVAYRVMFRLKVSDVSDSFRMYDAKKIKSIECQCDNFDIVEEILIRLKVRYPDFKIKEVPITFNKRMYGESKRDLIKFILSYIKTMYNLKKMELHEKGEKGVPFPVLIQFIKFGIVGVSNTIISYGLYVGSLLLFQHFAILPKADYLAAQVIAFVLSVLWSFYWNNKMVFVPEEGKQRIWWKALLKTYVSYSVTGLFLNSILLVLWVQLLHISEFLAPVINLVINVPLNFLLNKFWAFKTK